MVISRCGATICLREDLWAGCVPKWSFPELYYFAKNRSISLQGAAGIVDLQEILHLPISTDEAFSQLKTLLDNIDNCNVHNDNDSWVYIGGVLFTVQKKAYKYMKRHREIHPFSALVFLQPTQT